MLRLGIAFSAAIVLGALFLFIWASVPARVTGNVVNNSEQRVDEMVFSIGDDRTRLTTIAPGEDRPFSFSYHGRETSMTVRGKTAKGDELSADCQTYIDGAVRRADYKVELFAAHEKLHLRCVERARELKF